MGADLRRDGPLMTRNRNRLEEVMRLQIGLRSLSEAIVFDGTQQILGRAGYSVSIEFDPDLPSLALDRARAGRSEEHTSELQSLMRISYAVFCLKKKQTHK